MSDIPPDQAAMLMRREAPKVREAIREWDRMMAEQTMKYDQAIESGDQEQIDKESQMLVIFSLIAFLSLREVFARMKESRDLISELTSKKGDL